MATAQLNAMQMDPNHELLSDKMLEVVTNMEALSLEEAVHLSINAMSGTENANTIRLPAEV